MPESSLPREGGAVIFWTLAEWSSRDRLQEGFAAVGLDKFVPEPRPPAPALKAALEEVLGGPRMLLRPLARRDGFTVILEDRGESANVYAQVLIARVEGNNGDVRPTFQPETDERVPAVREAYQRHLGLLHTGQPSNSLVAILDALRGTRLRPSGGLYWLPERKLGDWQRAALAAEAAAEDKPSAVHILRHRLDAAAVRAIRDAIVAEVLTEASRMHDEIASGELGERALESRRAQLGQLREKIALYEDLLNVGLGGLYQAVDRSEQAAAAAILIASAQPQQAGAACAD
jgi:hypothetical protein